MQYGRELHQLSLQLKMQHESSSKEVKMMQDAFSLMAYSNPWKSPVSYQLNPSQREPVATALNSAILGKFCYDFTNLHISHMDLLDVLESQGYPSRPALEIIMAHASRMREEMARSGIGSATFCDANYYINVPYRSDTAW